MPLDTDKVIETLNGIMEAELAGVVRYTHFSLMVFGPARLPITQMLRDSAQEGLAHAVQAGEHVTALGGHPSLRIGRLLETHEHSIEQILKESLESEREALALYEQLLELVKDRSVPLEEYARTMIVEETAHQAELEKMLRAPGSLDPVQA